MISQTIEKFVENRKFSTQIEKTAFTYRLLDELGKDIANLKAQLKAKLVTYNNRYGKQVEGITIYETAGRKNLDKKALEKFLKAHGAKISDFETTGKPSTALKVTENVTVIEKTI